MKQRGFAFILALLASSGLLLAGCSADVEEPAGLAAPADANLVYEETVSPNQAVVTDEADIVHYVIQVYQTEENEIIVQADSNTGFFEGMEYTLAYDKPLAAGDVQVAWTTLMGNPEPSSEDQLAIAHVILAQDGEVISERSINFVTNALEIITETVNQNQKDN